MHRYRNLLIFIGLSICACTDWDLERINFTGVITIGTIEVGSTSAFLIGDIENIRMSRVIESGFVLSSTNNDDQSLRLDQPNTFSVLSPGLDTISEDRAFAARISNLEGSTQYYFRAYVKIEGEEQIAYGNIDQFLTVQFSVEIVSINRTSPGCPTSAIIELQVSGIPSISNDELGVVYSSEPGVIFPTLENGQKFWPQL